MTFSLFGKKPTTPPAKPAAAVRPASAGQAAQPAAKSAVPAGASPAKAPDFAERQPDKERPDLEFTSSSTPAKAAPKAAPQRKAQEIELRESTQALHPVAEEAAMLFANAREEDTRALLESAVRLDLGKAAELVWAQLFDLYSLSGNREAFEARALDYVVRFEKSPPSWNPPSRANASKAQAGPSTLALTGKLSEASRPQLEQIRRLAAKNQRIRIDLAKVPDADGTGCELLLSLTRELEKQGRELNLLGAAQFTTLLEKTLETGNREARAAWLLLLYLYQKQRRQATFEEQALQYAITFEESPPSWEDQPEPDPEVLKEEEEVIDSGFVLQGDITGGGSDIMASLTTHSNELNEVLIDATALRRMDFVSAGMLLNTLSGLAIKGKTISIKGVHALTFALFGVLGINQLARVQRRK